MKNHAYFIWRRIGTSILNFFKGEEFNMDVITYVKNTIQKKDLENLAKTKLTVMQHLEEGTPLVRNFEKKIRTYCKKYDLTRSTVLASILSDDIAASVFAKSASRQRTAEKSQLEYMQLKRGVRVERLPSTGYNSIRIQDGELVKGNSPKTISSTKSMDAISDNHHTIDYLYQKFTDGFGGAQDNQAMDAIRFLEAAQEYVDTHDDRIRFVAILDGSYYVRHWNVFASFATGRVMVETSDSYKRRGRKAVYVTSGGTRGKAATA
jgi:hypothetical protein